MTAPAARPLRVFMVGPWPADMDRIQGGVEAAVVGLARALAEHPAVERVLVASIHPGAAPPPPPDLGPRLEARHVRVPFIKGDSLIHCLQGVRALRPHVRAFRPDVVHGQGVGRQGDMAVQLGVASVVTVHGLLHVEARGAEGGVAGRFKAWSLERGAARVLGRADAAISLSDYDEREVAGLIRGARFTIPNAVPDVFFAASGAQPGKPPTALYAGLVRARKNVLGIVEAFARVRADLPEARLALAGPTYDPGYERRVEARIVELGLSGAVDRLGHLSPEALAAALGRCRALVMFSEQETLPTIIAQAMAAGRAVVSSDVGGVAEMVREGVTGLLAPAGDVEALADRLRTVLGPPAAARSLGAAGAAAAGRWRAAAIADSIVDAYRAAISRRG